MTFEERAPFALVEADQAVRFDALVVGRDDQGDGLDVVGERDRQLGVVQHGCVQRMSAGQYLVAFSGLARDENTQARLPVQGVDQRHDEVAGGTVFLDEADGGLRSPRERVRPAVEVLQRKRRQQR